MQTKSGTLHNPSDWARLCSRTTELVPRYGSRGQAFRAACAENPQLNSTPPSGEDVFPAHEQRQSSAAGASVNPGSGIPTPPEQSAKAKPWGVIFQELGIQTKAGRQTS
jgi:hypothetical protein